MIDQPFFIPSILILIIAIPLILGLIPQNRFYGVRTAQTFSNTRLWYAANRLAGWLFLIDSLIYLTATMVWPYSKTAKDDFQIWLTHLAAFLIPLILSGLILSNYLKSRR